MIERIRHDSNTAEMLASSVQKKKCCGNLSFVDGSRNSTIQREMKKMMGMYPRQMQNLQLKSIAGSGNLEGTVIHNQSINNGVLSASVMSAKNIKLKAGQNTLADEHAPSIDTVPGWAELQGFRLTSTDPHYVRMHLLNGHLGGRGDEVENLAPGSSDLNHAHYTEIESDLHDAVLAGKKINSYDVFCTYRSSPLSRFNNAQKKAYKHTLKEIHCQYILSDGTSVAKVIQEGAGTAAAWP